MAVEKFKYFTQTNPTNRYDVAAAAFKQARDDGYISDRGELNFGVGSLTSELAKSAKLKEIAERTPGTKEHSTRYAHEQRLFYKMGDTGRFYVKPRVDGRGKNIGTALMWRGVKKGHPFTTDVAIALSSDPKAKVSDFQKAGVDDRYELAEGLERNLFAERFHALYFAAFGAHAPTYPTEDEVKALDSYGKMEEAWRIYSAGDPRTAGKETK